MTEAKRQIMSPHSINTDVDDTDLSPWLVRARALGREFAATAASHDETGEFPFANFEALHRAGLLGLVTAREHGGLGGGLRAALAAVSAIAWGDPSTALVYAMHLNNHYGASHSDRWPAHLVERVTRANREGVALINSAQVEPVVGSPSHGTLPETIARRDGGNWRITGHKMYATGIPLLKWVTVLAVTDEAEPRIGLFLVPADAPGLRVERTWNATGMRATRSDDVILQDVTIPYEDALTLTPAAEGISHSERDSAWYLSFIGTVYDGAARAARDWIVDFAATRAPGSLGAPLATLPRFQDGIGQIEVLLGINRRLLGGLAEDFDLGRPFGSDAAFIKHVVVENAQAATLIALDLGGNPGISRDNPLERHHRNALSGKAHAPPNSLIRAKLARAALDRHAAERRDSGSPEASSIAERT